MLLQLKYCCHFVFCFCLLFLWLQFKSNTWIILPLVCLLVLWPPNKTTITKWHPLGRLELGAKQKPNDQMAPIRLFGIRRNKQTERVLHFMIRRNKNQTTKWHRSGCRHWSFGLMPAINKWTNGGTKELSFGTVYLFSV